jgi:hypothetical protein
MRIRQARIRWTMFSPSVELGLEPGVLEQATTASKLSRLRHSL